MIQLNKKKIEEFFKKECKKIKQDPDNFHISGEKLNYSIKVKYNLPNKMRISLYIDYGVTFSQYTLYDTFSQYTLYESDGKKEHYLFNQWPLDDKSNILYIPKKVLRRNKGFYSEAEMTILKIIKG
jgi:hypothetical protein